MSRSILAILRSIIIILVILCMVGVVWSFISLITLDSAEDLDTSAFTTPFILIFALVFVLIALLIVFGIVRRRIRDIDLKSWLPAEATILEVQDRGTVNEDILVGIKLEVRPPALPPYQTETKEVVPRIQPNRYWPGMVVNVLYDPKKPERVEIESRKSAGIAGSTVSVGTGAIIYQGKTYSNVDDLPREARAKYQQAMSALADKDGDGVPDILQSSGTVQGSQTFHSDATGSSEDPAEKLRKLKQMLYDGLITEKEYQEKKAEILSRM